MSKVGGGGLSTKLESIDLQDEPWTSPYRKPN